MSGPSPWNDELDARLTSDWAAGFSTAEIGRRMGISKNSVIGRAHRLQLPSRGSPILGVPWTEEEDALLQKLYEDALTNAEIGRRMQRSRIAINYRAVHLGLAVKRRAQQTGQRVSPSAQPWAGRGASSSPRHTRPATISRASSSRAVERLVSSPQVENLPGAVAEMPPPRVFLGTQCKFPLWGDERPVVPRFCAELVRDNVKGCASPYCAAHYAIAYTAPVKRPTHPPPATWLKNRGMVWARG